MLPAMNRVRFPQSDQYPPGWVEASVANSPSGLWVPDGLFKADAPTRRDLRRQRQYMNQLSQNYGKFFSTSTNTAGNPGKGLEKPPGAINFSALRAMSYSSQIDILIIGAIKAAARRFGQICDVPGKQKGFRVVHRRYLDSDFDSSTPDIMKRCAEMEELLRRPTSPPHQSFMDFLVTSIHEQLVVDRRCMVLPQDRGGRVGSYHLVDGTTIKPVIEVLAPWMSDNNITNPDKARFNMQIDLWRDPPKDPMSGAPVNVDMSNAAYVQVLEGRVVNAWTAEEMYVGIANPSIEIDRGFYGTSPLESSLYLSILFGKALRFNANLFDVTFPEGILAITGDYDEEGIEAFKRAALDFDPSEASTRLPVITGDAGVTAQLISLRESPQDMKMVEMLRMLANFKCAAYRVHPSIINVTDEGGGIQIGQGDDGAIEQSVGDGFHGYMIDQANFITQAIVAKRYDDLITIVDGLDDEDDMKSLEKLQIEKSFKTINEVRVSRALKELPEEVPEKIGDFIADGMYLQVYQVLASKAEQEQQSSMGAYEQGDFGQGDDSQGQPWAAGGGQGEQAGASQGDDGQAEEQGVAEAQQSNIEAGNTNAPAMVQKSDEETVTIRISGSNRTLADLIGRDDDNGVF